MNYALVGAFVLTLGAMLTAGLLWLLSGGASRQPVDLYLAIESESVAGLNLAAPVKYNGVAVGQVQDIRLDPANPDLVRLIFAIQRGVPIHSDTVAVLNTQGLTGIAYVELSGGTRDSPPLRARPGEDYPQILTHPSLSARLENVLTTVLTKLDRTSSNIDAVLSSANRQALGSALADTALILHGLAARRATIDAGITSAASTLDHTARTSAELPALVAKIGHSADALADMGNQTSAAATGAGRAFAAVEAGAQRFGDQTGPELQRLLSELDALAGTLRRLTTRAERNPADFLLGRNPVPEGPGEGRREAPGP